jgi:lysophospholipase L1-like esterase
MFPLKTTLTLATFAGLLLLPEVAPALKDYHTLSLADLSSVLGFSPRKGTPEPVVIPVNPPKIGQSAPPKNLRDPQHALDHFYLKLLSGEPVRILHYGDSPTTGDLITADARAALQKEFGDAGGGFILIARPWAWYNHRGVDMDSSGWKIDVAGTGHNEFKDGMHGLGGASFRGSAGATARWNWKEGLRGTLEVAYLQQPDGGSLSVQADAKEIGTADTAGDGKSPGYASFDIPPGARRFTLRVTRGTVRLYGVEFRKDSAGVEYSSLGINGANVTVLTRAFNERHWAAELKHYRPDLVIVNYGINESGFASFVDHQWAPEVTEAVRRLHAALPDASVLLMSPMDRGERKKSGEIDSVDTMPRLVEIESRVANDTGAAFFNTFEAMGGKGTMGRWYSSEPRLVGGDFIHPLPAGAKIVGELLVTALHDGLNDYKLRQLKHRMAEAESKHQAVEGGPKK